MQRLTFRVLATLVGCSLGCGGAGGANSGASAAAAAPNGAASAAPPDATPPPSNPGPATTTVALGDGGAAPGTKLPDAQPAGSDGSGPVPKGHTHDPGRGIDDIRAIVMGHRDEARACYDRALPDHPGLEGDLVVHWTIDPKGAVTQIALDSGRSKVTEPSVVGCIIGIIQKIQFAASPGGFETKASYPFNFHPRHVKQP